MAKSSQKHYWLGNVAKNRVISKILGDNLDTLKIIIFDYGCGDGGDWPQVLRDNDYLQLVGYEPNRPKYERAVYRLANLNAELFTGDTIESLDIKADYIVSFSVFEHVVNKMEYLYHARRLLADHGLFFLNYDDGHFRNVLDLQDYTTWIPAIRPRFRTLISPLMAKLGDESNYQRRVIAEEVDQMVKRAGFSIEQVDYHNLACLKGLAKSIPDYKKQDFSSWWLDTEITLNDQFKFAMPNRNKGDHINLWLQMASRTITCKVDSMVQM